MKEIKKKTWQYEKHGIDYKVIIDGKEYEFAAGEVSNNVWCFYLPKER